MICGMDLVYEHIYDRNQYSADMVGVRTALFYDKPL